MIDARTKGMTLCAVAVLAAARASLALPLTPMADPIAYDYAIDRLDVEKGHGALNDGDLETSVAWHTRFKSRTDIVLELTETHDVKRMELYLLKPNRWHIVSEIQVSVDDGRGDFGDPAVIPAFPRSTGADLVDASCTNHVFVLENLGRAVRVRASLFSDAHASVQEIRLAGRPVAAAVADAKIPAGTVRTVENANWKLSVSPIGGRAVALRSKAFGFDLVDPEAGAFVEEAWDRPASRGFLARKPYELSSETGKGGQFAVTATGAATGGGIDFLRIGKTYRISDDSTSLRIDYRLENIPEAMALQDYAPYLSAAVGVRGRKTTLFFPTADGIVRVNPSALGREYWGHRPARGWMAAVADDGTGIAVTMPARELRTFYSRFRAIPALDWRMIPVGIPEGGSYGVSTEVLPFRGLKAVSGAGGGLVGELGDGVCRIVSSRADAVEAVADGRSVSLTFSRPGELKSFKTAAKTVVLNRAGKEVCRLEAPPDAGFWRLKPVEPSRARTMQEIDLTRYTNFTHQALAPQWGRPLPGRRLKVAVLTGRGGQMEIGRLADRFDFDFRTVSVDPSGGYRTQREMANPVFSDGDGFSLVGVADVERGIAKVLDFAADVILVGGVPFELLNKDLRAQLVAKVKSGTGLVWIGQDRDVPELGFRLADGGKTHKGVPEAADPLYASVPLALLGGEDVYAIETGGGTVLATCGGSAWAVASQLGSGRVFNLGYRAITGVPFPYAGLTPADLRDFYEDKVAPVEYWYSLLAKTLLAAAGKELPIVFGKADVTAEKASVGIVSTVQGKTVAHWCAKDPFGDVLASGERPVSIAKGTQTLTLKGLDIQTAQGPLAFELVVKTPRGGVLNWGAWTFAAPPKAEIAALDIGERYRREGDTVKVGVKVSGMRDQGSGMRIRMRVVDSYGREMEEQLLTSGQESASPLTWSFRIANALPARCYEVWAEVVDAGRVVSRRRAELRVRPRDEKYAWDDFEVGIWAVGCDREYLWPDLADKFRQMGLSTVIANPPRMQIDFAMRHNLHPTLLSDAGLGRSPEPKDYATTGDKMKLVRGTCLSSPAYLAQREKAVAKTAGTLGQFGFRFVWYGDEQSITGYGGTPIDFCFSAHCLKEMRAFVKGKYGTLGRLNAEWETAFASWDDVVPFSRQEVWEAKGKHVAGWADHLEFMDSRLTNSVALSVNRLRRVDPAVKFALSGTQQPSAYGGMDWWKQLNVMDAALSYSGGGQLDIHRSFCPDGGFMPWVWGYANRGPMAVGHLWRAVFSGCRGLMGFQQTSQINPDGTWPQGMKDTLPSIRRIVGGTGRHFVGNLRGRHDVAVLYSQASIRCAFIEKRREEHEKVEEMTRLLLQNLGYAYDYVSYDQLAAGVPAKRGYKVLVLPDSAALSDGEIAGVKAFAAQGGAVVAFGLPGGRQANCRPRDASPLRDLFADGKHTLVAEKDVRYVKAIEYPDKPENAAIVDAGRKWMSAALEKGGVDHPACRVLNAETGAPVRNAVISPKFDAAENAVWCALGVSLPRTAETRFAFDGTAWTYDLVSGRCYGAVKELKLPFGPGNPYAFARFDGKVELKPIEVNAARLNLAYAVPVDGVVRVRVWRPDGTEAACYARNVTLRKGVGEYEIPFALSDPRGRWKVTAESVFGKETAEAVLERQ